MLVAGARRSAIPSDVGRCGRPLALYKRYHGPPGRIDHAFTKRTFGELGRAFLAVHEAPKDRFLFFWPGGPPALNRFIHVGVRPCSGSFQWTYYNVCRADGW